MDIKEVIIQGLLKESSEGSEISEKFRDTPHKIDGRVQMLADEVLKVYGKLQNNYGMFDSDTNTHPFPARLEEYYSDQLDLVDFSKAACRLIKSHMKSTASSNYVCFLRYRNRGADWVLIVLLKLKAGTGIDQETLELNESLAFDISHLHEAARVDLAKWQSNEQPYLSFIKNSKKKDVTQYFRLALGCTDYTDSKSHTDQAMKAIVAYYTDRKLEPKNIQKIRRAAYEYFNEKRQSGEPANLHALSALINDQEPESFVRFVKEREYQVGETFEPHASTYNRFKRVSGKFGSVSVAFDIQDVIDGHVDYDESLEKLIISNPSSRIIQDIKQAKGDDVSDEQA